MIRQMHSTMRMKQSAAMASHTPVTPSARGWIASHTRPIRSPHIPMMLTRREKRTSPEPRLMPPAMTVKLKKISVAAAINSVLLPKAMTSGSRLNRLMMGRENMATGTQAYFCGKPNPLMMRTGLRLLNCHSAEAVMVGDRMDTDVISGMESGMSTVLVLSGVSTRETLKKYAYRPSVVLNGVGDIASLARSSKTE